MCDLSPRAERVPAFTRESERGPFAREVENRDEKLYFQKKRDEGKPYMASVGHACRKMVSIIYAVMRDNKAYTSHIPNEISA